MNIDELRKEIADIDEELLVLLEKRMELSRQVGEYKKEKGLPIKNEEVEQQKLTVLLEKCKDEDRKYIEETFREIFNISCEIQNQ